MSQATRADVCAVAVAECFRNDGEIMVSPMGLLPALGARLAKRTFSPDITCGVNTVRLPSAVTRLRWRSEWRASPKRSRQPSASQ